jgi:protein-S-isoprenylcysteine O-methyltransferase Ste14
MLGVVVMGAAFVSLRKVIQIQPEPKATGQLVTTGVYRWLRHPIYTAILGIVLGLWLRRPTLLLAIVAAVVIVFLVMKSCYEERLLAMRYPQYSEYRKRSWGLIPGMR